MDWDITLMVGIVLGSIPLGVHWSGTGRKPSPGAWEPPEDNTEGEEEVGFLKGIFRHRERGMRRRAKGMNFDTPSVKPKAQEPAKVESAEDLLATAEIPVIREYHPVMRPMPVIEHQPEEPDFLPDPWGPAEQHDYKGRHRWEGDDPESTDILCLPDALNARRFDQLVASSKVEPFRGNPYPSRY